MNRHRNANYWLTAFTYGTAWTPNTTYRHQSSMLKQSDRLHIAITYILVRGSTCTLIPPQQLQITLQRLLSVPSVTELGSSWKNISTLGYRRFIYRIIYTVMANLMSTWRTCEEGPSTEEMHLSDWPVGVMVPAFSWLMIDGGGPPYYR